MDETVFVLAVSRAWQGNNYPSRKIPSDIAPSLEKLNGSPSSWWIGQLLIYAAQFTPNMAEFITDTITNIGFSQPIVGVHVRRTYKSKEAKLYSIEEYMVHVEEFYDVLELTEKVEKRRIFLSTDDPTVLAEAKAKYSHYEILYNQNFAEDAKVASRYSIESLKGIITDVYLLSLCDYLVCTFSSNIGSLAFEYMQTFHPDATDKVTSLDHFYVIPGARMQPGIAVMDHIPSENYEALLKVGDKIMFDIIYGTNYSIFIINSSQNKSGYVPAIKVERISDSLDMPT